jgi:hypothetical protein
MRGEQFFLHAANRKDLAAQRDFASHGDVAAGFYTLFVSHCHMNRKDLPIHVDMLLIIVMGYLISLLIYC